MAISLVDFGSKLKIPDSRSGIKSAVHAEWQTYSRRKSLNVKFYFSFLIKIELVF